MIVPRANCREAMAVPGNYVYGVSDLGEAVAVRVEVADGGRISVGTRSTEASLAGAVAGAIHRGMTR